MKCEIKQLDQIKRQLLVTIDKATYDRDYQKVLNKFSKNVHVKGFRKGKAPLSTLKRLYNDQIQSKFLDDCVQIYYKLGLDETKAEPVSQGSFSSMDTQENGDVIFVYGFETLPEGFDYEYKDLKIVFKAEEYSDKMLEDTLNKLLDENAEEIPFDENQQIEADDKVKLLDLITNEELPPFIVKQEEVNKYLNKDDEEISIYSVTGLKINGIVQAGEKQYKVIDAFKIKRPELNDETAKILGHDTVELLKNSLKENIIKDIENLNKYNSNLLITEAFGNKNIDNIIIPVDYQKSVAKRLLMQHFKGKLTAEMLDGFEEKFIMEIAQNNLPYMIWDIAYPKIATDHDISISEDELNEEIVKLANHYNISADDFKEKFSHNLENITEDLLSGKVLDFIRTYCVFTEDSVQLVEPELASVQAEGEVGEVEEADFEIVAENTDTTQPEKKVTKEKKPKVKKEVDKDTEDTNPPPEKKKRNYTKKNKD